MSTLQPIKLYSHDRAPNPFKVRIVLEKLGLPYTSQLVDFSEVKKPAYEAVNPNGRLPTIEDPNTGIKIWESGAIVQYLVDTYDKDHKISFASAAERAQEVQWLHFQMSGQGPYFGQMIWFKRFHHEKLPSAIERYDKEIKRVTMVLDRELAQREWLVGGKCTYADLIYAPWQWAIKSVDEGLFAELEKEYPHWAAWKDRVESDPVVHKLREERLEAFKNAAPIAVPNRE